MSSSSYPPPRNRLLVLRQSAAAYRSDWNAAALVLVTALVMLAFVLLDFRGSDYPGQIYRVGLFRDAGLTIWNSDWYSGHYTLGYSVLFPPLGAWLGISGVGVVSTLASVIAFRVLTVRLRWSGANVASWWFAIAMVVNFAVGRLTFGLGVAFGLYALVALQRRWAAPAIVLAVAAPLASPVAGLFLAIATTALAIDHRYFARRPWTAWDVRTPALMAFVALVPIGLTTILFRSSGVFPFRGGHFVGLVVTAVGLIVLLSKQNRAIGIAAALTIVIAVPVFFISNPLGGNMVRLPVIFAGPILAGMLLPSRRGLVALAAIPLCLWVLVPVTSATKNVGAESAQAEFYQPVINFINRADGPSGRIEIPFTEGHWETAYIAGVLPIARGWERQTDIAENALFYDGTLDAASYRAWLLEHAVRWVAVPDAPIDHGGQAEVALLESTDLPWLPVAWSSDDWVIYEVTDAAPLVGAPGRLLSREGDGLVIEVDEPGDVLVRETFTPYWDVSGVAGCVFESPDGFTIIRANEAGRATLRADFSLGGAIPDSTPDC